MSDAELIAEVVRRVVREVERRGGDDAVAPTCACSGGAAAAAAAAPAAPVPAPWPPRRVAIGSDHGGVDLKADLAEFLRRRGYQVVDCGTRDKQSVDYPDFAAAVARQVAEGRCEAGIVIDGAGIGSGMAANKIRGVRCAVCHDLATVRNSREHNDANVLSLGAKVVSANLARRMAAVWLETMHAGGRHRARVEKIVELER
jgi:ribose 5-phosphate isomerase B